MGLFEDMANASAQLVQSSDAHIDSEDLVCFNSLDGSFREIRVGFDNTNFSKSKSRNFSFVS